MMCTTADQGPDHEGTSFQVHLLQDVLDSNSQFIASCGGKGSCLLHRFSTTEWVLGAELPHVDHVVVAFIGSELHCLYSAIKDQSRKGRVSFITWNMASGTMLWCW